MLIYMREKGCGEGYIFSDSFTASIVDGHEQNGIQFN